MPGPLPATPSGVAGSGVPAPSAGTRPPGAVVSPAADATMRARWRALTLTDPIARLVRNAAHAGIDDAEFDLRQLALAAVDLVVGSMGFAREATVAEVADDLTALAVRMRPDRAEQARDVAQAVLKGLLNEAHEQRRFTYWFTDLAGGEPVREPYRFRLLSLRETEYGAVLTASDQAITLFLHGLDVDIEDADRALAHVLQRQLDDRRFDAAVRTAAQAERTSVGLAALVSDLLDATRRDVGSHDWLTDVPARLAAARRHVEERIAEDDRFLEHVLAGLDGGDASPEVRAASGRIVDLLGRVRQVHLDLERRLVGARAVFLAAHVRQRLARPRRLRLLGLTEDVLQPVLGLPEAAADAVTGTFAERALGVSVPRLVRLDDLLDQLFAPPRAREAVDPPQEETAPPDGGEDTQSYPEAVVAAAREVLDEARTGPVGLSTLLDRAQDPEVAELVLLTALWAFAPDPDDGDGSTGPAGGLAVGLVAEDTGRPLRHRWARGTELVLSPRLGTARVDGHSADETDLIAEVIR